MNVLVWFEILMWVLVPVIFIGIVTYVLRPSARERYREDGQIPFRDEGGKPQSGSKE